MNLLVCSKKRLAPNMSCFFRSSKQCRAEGPDAVYERPPAIVVTDNCKTFSSSQSNRFHGEAERAPVRRRKSLYLAANARRRSSASSSPPPKHYGCHYDSGLESADDSLSSGSDRSSLGGSLRSLNRSGSRSSSLAPMETSPSRERPASRRDDRVRFHPDVKFWSALRKGKFERVYEILLHEWRCASAAEEGAVAAPDLGTIGCKTRRCLSSGITVNSADNRGITALHLCAFAGSPRCVRLLLALGANAKVGDTDNWTPLHAAAVKGHRDIIMMLACSGASVRTRDRAGRTPSDVANSEETKNLLKKLGKMEKQGDILAV